ncbi:MAG: hypothetical protein Q9222_006819 [Ikaeria aurantiellina]
MSLVYQHSPGSVLPTLRRIRATVTRSDPRDYDSNAGQVAKDPAKHGLQIFDLTEVQWTSQYDANAEPYKSP